MKRIYSILVENRAGVLCKTAGLFWRRCFNIDSITVGETDDREVSSMVIVSSGDERTLEQIEKQLNKKLDVIKVKTFDESESINRELLLVKIKYNRGNRRDIMDNCQILGARIVDMSRSQMMIEMCDTPERVAIFMDTLKSFSIVEITRTGKPEFYGVRRTRSVLESSNATLHVHALDRACTVTRGLSRVNCIIVHVDFNAAQRYNGVYVM